MKMKSNIKIIIIANLFVLLSACVDLNLNPLSEASSETWFKEVDQFEMSVNDLFKPAFWQVDDIEWTDDYVRREILNPITNGTLNSDWAYLANAWSNKYKAIARSNSILNYIDFANIPQTSKDIIIGNAAFVRAAQYSYLIDHWGDVVLYTELLSLEDAFALGRTEKSKVLSQIYEDFDTAIAKLPVSYGGKQLATKGAALAMKARIALHQEDWVVARNASKACLDLGIYDLFPNYGELFKSSTKNPKEVIFAIPASEEFGVYNLWPVTSVQGVISRISGGQANNYPSFELFCAYPCTDGLPINKSPLFNPREPFLNRDPRLLETIVPFGENYFGYTYYSHPDSLTVFNTNTGAFVKNANALSVDRYAPYNGLLWKKGVDQFWFDNIVRNKNDLIIMRYADVLLMYAEAKIELNDIDQSVFDAINMVRARAYKVSISDTSNYPAVVEQDQNKLRQLLRNERRIEFAYEPHRYMDIIRWKLAEKVLKKPIYGLLPVDLLRKKIIDKGLWFFPDIPEIDEEYIADLGSMYEAGYYRILSRPNFDISKQYLWPIPSKEIRINTNMTQNPGY